MRDSSSKKKETRRVSTTTLTEIYILGIGWETSFMGMESIFFKMVFFVPPSIR